MSVSGDVQSREKVDQMAYLAGQLAQPVLSISTGPGVLGLGVLICPSAYIQSIRDGARVYDALARGYASRSTTGTTAVRRFPGCVRSMVVDGGGWWWYWWVVVLLHAMTYLGIIYGRALANRSTPFFVDPIL